MQALPSDAQMLTYQPQPKAGSSGNTLFEGAAFTSFDLQDFSIYRPPEKEEAGTDYPVNLPDCKIFV